MSQQVKIPVGSKSTFEETPTQIFENAKDDNEQFT